MFDDPEINAHVTALYCFADNIFELSGKSQYFRTAKFEIADPEHAANWIKLYMGCQKTSYLQSVFPSLAALLKKNQTWKMVQKLIIDFLISNSSAIYDVEWEAFEIVPKIANSIKATKRFGL